MEELEQEDELKNHDAQYHTEKTKSAMTQEEKDLVHNEIDFKMQELEDTGLSRMEILYNVEKGIPLSDDPVFQYLKQNRIAREMLVKATEVFTADAVVERALRQDLEPDPTMAKMYQHKRSIQDDFDPLRHYKQKYKDKHPLINEESYIYGIDTINEVMDELPGMDINHRKKTDWIMKRKYDQLKWEQEKPPIFINKPLTRDKAREKFMRKINPDDFHWKNTPFWIQFLTKHGKIKNKFQTRLSDSAQKRLTKTVKHARTLGLIPYVGIIRPTDKIPLRSFYEDLEEFNKKSVDPITGKMYYKATHSDLGKKFEKPKGIDTETESYKDKDFTIDDIPNVLNKHQMQWLEAQEHIIQSKKASKRILTSKEEQMKEKKPSITGELAFKNITKALDEVSGVDDIPELFLNEKAYFHVNKQKK
jgi:ribosomal protein S18